MMEIPGNVLQDIVQNSVKQGDVFLIEMDSQGKQSIFTVLRMN